MEFMSDIVGGLSGRILQAADSAPRGERFGGHKPAGGR